MIISIEGEEATGKTTLAYSAPLPIVGFSFDVGTERALMGAKYEELFAGLNIETVNYKKGDVPKKAWEGKDITVYEIPQPIQLDSNKLIGFRDTWDYFITLCGMVAQDCMDGKVNSCVIDTMTLARRIKADAYLQELQEQTPSNKPMRKQLLQIEYGHANDSIRNIYTLFGGLRANLVATHHLTDERKDTIDKDGAPVSVITGNRVLEGLTQTARYVDVGLRMLKRDKKLVAEVTKCGYALELEGTLIPNPSWDKVIQLVSDSIQGRIRFQKRNPDA